MLDLMGPLWSLVKLQSVHIDNVVFYLHYKPTVTLLIAFSALVASRQYFGEPIDCEFVGYDFGKLNNYCYVKATFVSEPTGKHGDSGHAEEDNVRYCSYYSWVSVTLFIQALVFYTPRYIWKALEGGRTKILAAGADCATLSKDCIEKETKRLSKYFSEYLHTHNLCAYQYFSCEVFNLINILCQICFMNRFIGDGFQSYGLDVILRRNKNKAGGVDELFPTRTVCIFERYSLTGIKDKLEGVCLLNHNPLNEKIYGLLWFWLHFVAIVTGLVMIYRLLTFFSSSFRFRVFLLSATRNKVDEVRAAFNKLRIGDWFMLILLEKNVNPQVFQQLITKLAQGESDDTDSVYGSVESSSMCSVHDKQT